MPTSSMTEYDELTNETEIVFTATPEFDEHFNSIPPRRIEPALEPVPKFSDIGDADQSQADEHVGDAPDQDAVAKQQVDRLKAKLESHQRSGADAESRQLRFKQLINETRGLNKESEKFNTQSAVLLSALSGLKSEFEESEAGKATVIAELYKLSGSAQGLLHDLKLSKADADESHARSISTQQSSEKLISELDVLTQQTESQQKTSAELLKELEKEFQVVTEKRETALTNTNRISELANNSHKLLEEAELANRQAQLRSDKLGAALELHQDAKSEIQALSASLSDLKLDLEQEKEIQQRLNQQSKTQIQHTEKLNDQQTTLIELTQSRHDELKNELSGSLETVKKYQNKLQQTEAKLKDAADLQERYRDQYSEALSKLESNETLLRNAAKALVETNSQNGKFNSSISKFQHATEQSQQLVIRTQTTLESVLTRNQLLERENKLLAQKINSLSSVAPQPRANPAPASNMGFGSLNDMNFTDPQAGPQAPPENKNGFFKLMVVLAILIPLSFIAHSVINSTNAEPNSSLDLGNNSENSIRTIK